MTGKGAERHGLEEALFLSCNSTRNSFRLLSNFFLQMLVLFLILVFCSLNCEK